METPNSKYKSNQRSTKADFNQLSGMAVEFFKASLPGEKNSTPLQWSPEEFCYCSNQAKVCKILEDRSLFKTTYLPASGLFFISKPYS